MQRTGAYEVWDGHAANGSPVTMVTVTPTASRDPAVRAAFSATVGWAIAHAGPALPVLGADSVGSAPWLALARDPHRRGAAQVLSRLLDQSTLDQAPWPADPMYAHPASPSDQREHADQPQPIDPSQPVGPPSVVHPQAGGEPPSVVYPVDGPYPAAGADPGAGPHAADRPYGAPRRRRALLIGVLAGVLALAVVATAVFAVWRIDRRDQVSRTLPNTAPSPDGSHPTWRSAAPVVVLGPTFGPRDRTRTWDFVDWPFAFRTTEEAACEFGVGRPDHKAYNCRYGTEPNHTVMAIVVRRCVNGCNDAERAQLDSLTPWPPDEPLTVVDHTTKYADVSYGNGRTQFTMIHYFAAPPGARLQWVVIFQGNAPRSRHNLVLKTANDIRTQTS